MSAWADLGRPSVEAARLLLGATVRHDGVAVRLTEVEAYDGARDPGSHGHRGPTERTRTMFGPAGHLYCYFVYGMHVCANVVTGPEGEASAVLMRAGEVVEGLAEARSRRPGAVDRELARGPARLCRALGIALAHDGTDLSRGPVTLELAEPAPTSAVSAGPRVGLRLAPENPWRFWLTGDPTVSAYRPAAPRRARRTVSPGSRPTKGTP